MDMQTVSFMKTAEHHRTTEQVNRHGWMFEAARSGQTPIVHSKGGSRSLRTRLDAAAALVRSWIAAHDAWLDQVPAQR